MIVTILLLKFSNYQFSHLPPPPMNVITIIPLTTVNSWHPLNVSKVPNVVDTSPTGTESGCDCGQVQSQPHSQLCHGSNSTGLTGAGGEFLNAKQPLLPKQMLAASPLISQNLSQHLQHKPPLTVLSFSTHELITALSSVLPLVVRMEEHRIITWLKKANIKKILIDASEFINSHEQTGSLRRSIQFVILPGGLNNRELSKKEASGWLHMRTF